MATKKSMGGELLKIMGKAGSTARKNPSKDATDWARTRIGTTNKNVTETPKGEKADVIEFDKDYRDHPDWRKGMSKDEVLDMMGSPKYDEDGVRRKRGGKVDSKVVGSRSDKRWDRRRRK